MSLSDQQWCPTSVQVTVLQARGLRIKGKGGTNDAYALMQVGKEKYQTSVVEKTVAPTWKEEATFDLPPLQGGGAGKERSTLRVHVLHRALVGPDKLLGQAVIDLLLLSDDKTRNKTEWFKLLDKTGKPDKDRGEVLVDIQFMRNNMTASMFDLSSAGKSRSRLGKFKDKVRGKKRESDSSSGVVPSITQVLTDSEEDDTSGGGEGATGKDGKSKQHKRMSLFSSKSNLQRNMSQSMSVLPGKNSSLSGSQSSGLNVDSSEGKKKFNFKIHKHSSNSKSKDSSSGQQKQEQSNVCINGSHIYCEEAPPRPLRTGSSFSQSSSINESREDAPENFSPSVDSVKAQREYSSWMEKEEEEKDEIIEDLQEEEEEEKFELKMDIIKEEEEEAIRKQGEQDRLTAEKLKEDEEDRVKKEEMQRLEEEKRWLEEQERRKFDEEEKMRREEEEKIKEELDRKRHEEELKLAEERRLMEEEEERRMEEKVKHEQERAEMWKKEQEEKKKREEEDRLKKEEKRIEEEKARRENDHASEKKQEEEGRIDGEEKFRKAESERIRIEEMKRKKNEEKLAEMKEQEQKRRDQQKMQREEERKKAEEQAKRQEEERIQKEKMRREEEEDRRLERLAKEKLREQERIKAEEEQAKREEEERIQKEKMRREEEERREAEEQQAKREEEERIQKEKMRREEEERREAEEQRAKREEEERIQKEKMRREEEERREAEEQQAKREEEERIQKEKMRREEEERREAEEQRAKREEEERIQKEKMRREEEERREAEEQRAKREEEERIQKEKMRREEEERREAEEQRAKREEEERIQKEKMRREEEERKKKEERRRQDELEWLAKENLRKAEEERREVEKEQAKREEEERIQKEKMTREEEERKKMEEEEERREVEKERAKREEEERTEKEKMIKEERAKKESMEKEMREEKMIQKEKMSREKEEERRRHEELEWLAKQKLRKEEEERRNLEEEAKREEERIQKEIQREEERVEREMRGEEERIKEEKKTAEENERKGFKDEKEKGEEERRQENLAKEKEGKIKDKEISGTKFKLRVPVEITSTNPFDENISPPLETNISYKAKTDDQRCRSAVPSVKVSDVTTNERDLINTQRGKRTAPKPPGRNQPQRQRREEKDMSSTHLSQMNKQSKDKNVKTVSVAPQRSVQIIAPLNRPSKDLNNLSQTEKDFTKEETTKNGKRPAPSVPCTAKDEPHRGVLKIKKDGTNYGLNPFEDDDDDTELTAFDETTNSGKTDPVCWPPVKQETDKDDARIKSSKMARAPLPPTLNKTPSNSIICQNRDEDGGSDAIRAIVPNNTCNPQKETNSHVQVKESPNRESKQIGTVGAIKEEGPPAASRRLQPVKPLNPLEQQSDSVVKVGNENRATGLDCNGVQHKTNVGTERSGPYSQLTREELIALLLKQESQLSERDKKISELEQYIDNLLVRVIEEKPSILMSLSSLKKAA